MGVNVFPGMSNYMTREESLERVLNDVARNDLWASMSTGMSLLCGGVAFGTWALAPRELVTVISTCTGIAGMGLGALALERMYASYGLMRDYLTDPEAFVKKQYHEDLIDE